MPTPIERALDTADRIIAANRKLEELSVRTIPTPPAGVVLKLAEEVRRTMTAEAIANGRPESEGTFAPLWRRIWLTAQAYELTGAGNRAEETSVLVQESATLIQLCQAVDDVLTASAARKLYFALTGETRVQPEHLVGYERESDGRYLQAD